MDKLRFGTAGIPFSTHPRDTVHGVSRVRELGLDTMELEFVQSVNISSALALEVKKAAQKADVALTCHGQYFINLNALEEAKVHASVQRIVSAALRAWECGAWSMTFHPGYYLGQDSGRVYQKIRKNLKEAVRQVQNAGCTIWVRPETTGKPTQFGTVDEILQLSQEIEQVMPCIDFSHLHARMGGGENTSAEFRATLEKVEKALGKEGLHAMHIHLSGIAYSEKGEKHHLLLEESDLRYKDLLRVLKEFNVRGSLTCESPNIEGDALLLQKVYKEV